MYRLYKRENEDGPFLTIEVFGHGQWIELKRDDPNFSAILVKELLEVNHD